MAIEVTLPELGEGIETGDILDVLVSEGDTITQNQAILELETDKATVEVPSSHAGKVVRIHVNKGQTIAIGTAILSLDVVASAPAPPAPRPTAPERPAPGIQPVKTVAPEPVVSTPNPNNSHAPPKTTAPSDQPDFQPAPAPAQVAAAQTTHTIDPSVVPAGPAIRRFAREVGVDISQVSGTGEDGRITREDVLAVVRQVNQPARAVSQPSQITAATPPTGAEPPSSVTTSATIDAWGPIQIEPMTKIRKTISARMHDSWSTVARVTNFDDADVTELETIRIASKADYAARGIKLTQMPFVLKSVAMSLRTNPMINASIDVVNQQIIYKKYVNLGIAVDTDRGLVVLSLRGADQLSIPDIARALATIAENARTNTFTLDDLRGNTFTISNLGAIGGTYATPIVNIPEVAILLLGRSRKMPVVVDDEIKIRLMMPLSLSYDHRLVDGAIAARFLNDLIGYLETPSRLLIAP